MHITLNRKTTCQKFIFLSFSVAWTALVTCFSHITHISFCCNCQWKFQVECITYLEYLYLLYTCHSPPEELEKDLVQQTRAFNNTEEIVVQYVYYKTLRLPFFSLAIKLQFHILNTRHLEFFLKILLHSCTARWGFFGLGCGGFFFFNNLCTLQQ